ncbi:MAG TPA: IS3 family transposase [Bacillota bacterium]|nr:IS3 family transposase [Bacillota bacterium]HOL09997.1 IS3 family transposase [Bacillota bacterium]HPO97746.1 IS3 family transposase [Bacillota bacterium]
MKCIGLAPATYYYHLASPQKSEITGGRPLPGYSYDKSGQKICDQQIIEWIYRLIDGEGFSYGYRKLTILLKRNYNLVINKKKVYRLCKQEGQRIPCRTPNKNAHIESFHSILENDCLSRYEFQTCAEAYEKVSDYLKFYNYENQRDKTIVSKVWGLTRI